MTLPTRSTTIKATIGGLLTAAVGVFLQYLTLPEDFPTVPPGPIILAAAAAIVAFGSRWSWTPVLGVGVALMIAIGGLLNGGLVDNLTDFPGPAFGAAMTLIGVGTAIVAGVAAVLPNSQDRHPHAAHR